MLHAIIMAGGSGTRFWPASRRLRPKQLLALSGEQTMLQGTMTRLGDLVPPERQMILTKLLIRIEKFLMNREKFLMITNGKFMKLLLQYIMLHHRCAIHLFGYL